MKNKSLTPCVAPPSSERAPAISGWGFRAAPVPVVAEVDVEEERYAETFFYFDANQWAATIPPASKGK